MVLVGGGVLAAVVLVGGWFAWVVWQAAGDLQEVERQGQLIRAELVDGDVDGAARALEAFQEAAAEAESATDGPTWWVAEHVPVLGDDAEGVAVAARVLSDIGDEALPPLVDAAADVTARTFHPTRHRFPLAAIAATQEPAAASEAVFADAAAQLSAVDSSGFTGPVGGRFDDLRRLVLQARSTLGSVYRAAEMMPTLLGRDGPRDYLLVMQNNAELRPLGGLAGSISLVHADDGRVDITDQMASSHLGILERPVLPLNEEEQQLFGSQLGRFFRDANLTPHVPRAAELMAARWRAETGQDVDGVFLVDPVAIAYLLRATGPVDVPGFPAATSTNVVAAVENEIYLQTYDSRVHDDYQNAVAKSVFNAFAGGAGDPAELIRALVAAVAEGRIRMHSFEEPVQEAVDGTAIAGEVAGERPALGVYLSDTTESKMSYYLRYSVDVVARSCAGSVQEVTGVVRLHNDPPDGVPLPKSVAGFRPVGQPGYVTGQQSVLLYLMGPPGGSLEKLEIGERDMTLPVVYPFRGRWIAPVTVTLDPEEETTVQFLLRGGTGNTHDLDLQVTPGSAFGSESATVRSACPSR